jgi:superfamily II DNA/RNA helicase
LSKQAKIGYNALYNVVSGSRVINDSVTQFDVPLCLNSDNKVALTEKNFIFFESVLAELHISGFYTLVHNSGRAVDEVRTDYKTVRIYVSKSAKELEKVRLPMEKSIETFDFSEVDTSKLMKRNGKEEKAKTEENKAKTEEEKKTVEETSKALEETSKELAETKKELAKKEEQLNKKAIAEFNDDALLSIADCIEVLIKKHCPIPSDFDFSAFETDLFKAIENKWDLKAIEK